MKGSLLAVLAALLVGCSPPAGLEPVRQGPTPGGLNVLQVETPAGLATCVFFDYGDHGDSGGMSCTWDEQE